MTFRVRSTAFLVTAALLAPFTSAQDSTQITPGGPGDAVAPWSDGTGAFDLFPSEQCNDYVVDMDRLTSSWGTPFGIAPVVKSSKLGTANLSSLIDAQAISRLQKTGVSTYAGSYAAWSGPGFGINDDPAKNFVPGTFATTTPTNQFTVAFNEGGETDAPGIFYDGVVGAVVNFVPSQPGRLFVSRVNAASNSCFPTANLGSIAMGSVDEDGNVFVRYDNFGAMGGCGLTTPPAGTTIMSVDITARDCGKINVFSGLPQTLLDAAATSTYIFGNAIAHSTPGNIPESIAGAPTYGGVTFGPGYKHGPAGGVVDGLTSFFDGSVSDSRGNVGYMATDYAPLLSTGGAYSILARSIAAGGGITDTLNIFGVDTVGAVTGTLAATLPPSITDPKTGFTTLTGIGVVPEFDHYHSQVPFQGGNGHVALGTDQDDNLLAAATFDHPSDAGSAHPVNAIGVAKWSPTGTFLGWTLAAYNNFPGVAGKPILSSSGGSTVYEMVTIGEVTGDPADGPSMSAPAMDSVGNLYFTAAIKEVSSGDFSVGLIRAVYDPVRFSYELELILKSGDEFEGQNSGVDYLISFIDLIDANSIDSGAFWSGNVSEVAHGSMSTAGLETADPRTLGGLVLSAQIIYDVNDDGSYDTAPVGMDEDYNVLLYIGHRLFEDVGFPKARASGVDPVLEMDGSLIPGVRVGFGFRDAEPFESAWTILGFSGAFIAPFKCSGVLVPSPDIIFKPFPTGPSGAFGFDLPWPGPPLASGFPLHWQIWFSGTSECGLFSSTNGLKSVTH